MQRALDGATILVTGATGFLGKAVVEKLLRSAPQIDKVPPHSYLPIYVKQNANLARVAQIYVQIRPRAGTTPAMRLQDEIIGSKIFDRLRRERPSDFSEYVDDKLHVVGGDTTLDNLGMSTDDAARLQAKVNVVINSAANVSWDNDLRESLNANSVGAMNALKFSERCENLRCHVHVSSAYVNSNQRNVQIHEKLYPLDFDVNAKFHEITNASAEESEKLAHNILNSGYPNTYTFTKSMAEHLVAERAAKKNIPLVIFRPTTIGAAWKDPVPGWVDQVMALGSVYVAMSKGFVSVLPGNPQTVFDVVPVDMSANSLLTAAGFKMTETPQLQQKPLIMHCGSSDPRQSPVQLDYLLGEAAKYYRKNPPPKALAPCKMHVTPSSMRFHTHWYLKHTLPSYLYATMAACTRNPKHEMQAMGYSKVSRQALRMISLYRPFTENDWVFRTDALHDQIDAFESSDEWWHSVGGLAWDDYIDNYCSGLQKFAVRDKSPKAKL